MAAWANVHLTKSMIFYKVGLWEVFSQALNQNGGGGGIEGMGEQK